MIDQEIRDLEREYVSNPKVGFRLLNLYKRIGNQKYLESRTKMGYVAEISVLPIPSLQQTKGFLGYVATAHSWYKHLDSKIPTKFTFFLDPHVMMLYNQETNTFSETPENYFHYSSRLTSKYLSDYGYWNYSLDDTIFVYSESMQKILLPENLMKSGSALVTRAMHGVSLEKNISLDPEHPERDEYLNFIIQNNELKIQEHAKMFEAMNNFLKELQKQKEELGLSGN